MNEVTTTAAVAQIRTRTMALLDATVALCDDIYQGRRDVPVVAWGRDWLGN